MKKCFKFLLLVSVAAAFNPAANAQSSTTEQRLQTLEAMVAQLRAELEAEKAKTNAEIVTLKKTNSTVLPVAEKSGGNGFSVGGTTFKIGGFIDLDTHVTQMDGGPFGAGSIARDFYIPSVTPIGGEKTTVTDMTAQASRLQISGTRNVGEKKATGLIEMDFLGSAQGNQRVSNSYSPRLRRAYVDYDGWRIGQEWSTFQNTSAIPESASFLAASDGMAFIRQPQIRYTSGNFQFALENGNATITPAGGSGRIEADGNVIPDVVARYNLKGDFGNISLAAMGRQLRLETGSTDESTTGFGLSASGRIKVGSKDDIRFNLIGGEGMGRYVGLNAFNGAAIDPVTGDLEAIPSYGGLVAWRHPFGDSSRISLGYSALFADNPDFLSVLNPGTNKSVQSGFAAFLWDVAPKLTLGVEGLYGVRELENGLDGDIKRLTFSTKYGF